MAGNLDVEEEHRLRWVQVRQWQSTLEIPLRLLNCNIITVIQAFAMFVIMFVGIRVQRGFVTETKQCGRAENGVCEDGLAGSNSSLCGSGSDCVDCMSDAMGVRINYEVLDNYYATRDDVLRGDVNLTRGGQEHVVLSCFPPSAFLPPNLPNFRLSAAPSPQLPSLSRSQLAITCVPVDLAAGATVGREAHMSNFFC